jgi:hypothetical protein
MKHLLCLITAIMTMTVFSGGGWAEDKREGKPRFKGVELYSWRDKGGDWLFVLLDGTNRNKTQDEVKGAEKPIKGTEDLKKAISLLAEGEQVSWSHRIEGFEFPPEAKQKEIQKAAEGAKIVLRISGDK